MSEPVRVVVEDPAVARVLLDALMRDTNAQLRADRERRRNGLPGRAVMPPQNVLNELGVLADQAVPVLRSEVGTVVATVGSPCWVTVSEAADRFGISEEYTRRLARTGRVRRQRRGLMWLIDTDSLGNVLRRTA